MSEYPEHNKMRAVQPFSQKIGEFIAWLDEQGIFLARNGEWGDVAPIYEPVQGILARFFEIDLKKIEDEKRQMLDEMRQLNERTIKIP